MRYLDSVSKLLRDYFKVLSDDFPHWLDDYISTKEMQRIGKISMDCGNDYVALHEDHDFISNLDHSVGVALILWHFTKDKKQTIAGLFHDIATPVFKHCIDIMNGDMQHQESTEEYTYDIINNSDEIMYLLKRDGISIDEVCDYKIYPLADNSTPRLAADRLEYNFSQGLVTHPIWTIADIKDVYDDIIIVKNEDMKDEYAFSHLEKAEKYISFTCKLWPYWICKEDRISMQFFASMCQAMNKKGYLLINDLYTLSEKEVLKKFNTCPDSYLKDKFERFQKTDKCYASDTEVKDKYCINVKAKRRYTNPLVKENNLFGRVYDLSFKARQNIDDYMMLPDSGFVYLDFDFKI